MRRKIAHQRADYTDKLSRSLVDRFDVIVHEELRIADMVASASGTVEHPGTMVAQKQGLNRSIHDAGWGQLSRSSNTKRKRLVGRRSW